MTNEDIGAGNVEVERAFNDLLMESAGDSATARDIAARNMAVEQDFNNLLNAIQDR